MIENFERRPGSRNLAYFRVWSESLGPEEISRLLDHQPTRSEEKGSPRFRGPKPILPKHLWLLSSGIDEEAHIQEHLARLLVFALEKEDVVRKLLANEGTEVEIVCSFGDVSGQYPVSLHPRLLSLLGDMGVALRLAWWMPEQGEEPEDETVPTEWRHLRRVPGSVFLKGLPEELFQMKD